MNKMPFKESEAKEFKSTLIDDIKKGVIALANSGGGTLYVGIADKGNIVGLLEGENLLSAAFMQ